MRGALKKAAYAAGLFRLRQEARQRAGLTVAMFHRVLPAAELDGSDPGYTVSDRLFAECVAFFRRNYNIVAPEEVSAAVAGESGLPPRALLISFDDGWDDNLRHAAPILLRAGLPAVIFLAADPLQDTAARWWQSVLIDALRDGRLTYEAAWSMMEDGTPPPPGADRLILLLHRFGRGDAGLRDRVLAPFEVDRGHRDMLTPDRAIELPAAGVRVGSHGASHLPLTLLDQPADDLKRSRDLLERLWPGLRERPISLSFPHGRYSGELVTQVLDTGFCPVFTSDPVINVPRAGRLSRLLGRIEIPAHEVQDANGRLVEERLAAWLMSRECGHLAVVSEMQG